jgi:hypothetical protein
MYFRACQVLDRFDEKVIMTDVLSTVVTALGDTADVVRYLTCDILGDMGAKAATNEMIGALVIAMDFDEEYDFKWKIMRTLVKMRDKLTKKNVIGALVIANGGDSRMASSALGRITEKYQQIT